MIMVDVKDILTFAMENTVHEVDMSRYWFKFDTEVGLLEKDLYKLYNKDYIDFLKKEALIRAGKPYILTYSPLIIFPMYYYIYNEICEDPRLLLGNNFLSNSNIIIGEHIVNASNVDEIIGNILDALYLKFNNNSNYMLFIKFLLDLERKLWKQYFDILEDRIINISINRVGCMIIEPGENIYKYRYNELVDSVKNGYGDINGE